MSRTLQPCRLQHARLPCPSLSPSLLKLMSIESVTPLVERYKKPLAVVLYLQNTLGRRQITSAVRLCIRLCVLEADPWLLLQCSLLPLEGSAGPRMTLVKRLLGGPHLPLLEQMSG